MNEHFPGGLGHKTIPLPLRNPSKEQRNGIAIHWLRQFKSSYLTTQFSIDIYLPPEIEGPSTRLFPLLFINDGQDMDRVSLSNTLHRLYSFNQIEPLIVVAVHVGERLQEYGIAGKADYKKRGNKAGLYSKFIINELLPHIHENFPCETNPSAVAFAGFSLGGLSAMDIAWHHPSVFGKIGVFSGSFWWRSKDFTDQHPDANRIMHETLNRSSPRPDMKFWLQTGTMDETSDRNNNGIIDAIDDTLDIIGELKKTRIPA